MSSHSGSYQLGPDNATLTLRTGTAGVMAKAGHSLEIRVDSWSTRLELGDEPTAVSLTLEVDSHSLTVISGHGGPKPLSDEDKVKIAGIINDKIFQGAEISFRSTGAEPDGSGGVMVHGDLNLLGSTGPARFTMTIGDDGQLSAATEIKQTAFGLEPHSAMRGALKLKDEVIIEVVGQLPVT